MTYVGLADYFIAIGTKLNPYYRIFQILFYTRNDSAFLYEINAEFYAFSFLDHKRVN